VFRQAEEVLTRLFGKSAGGQGRWSTSSLRAAINGDSLGSVKGTNLKHKKVRYLNFEYYNKEEKSDILGKGG